MAENTRNYNLDIIGISLMNAIPPTRFPREAGTVLESQSRQCGTVLEEIEVVQIFMCVNPFPEFHSVTFFKYQPSPFLFHF